MDKPHKVKHARKARPTPTIAQEGAPAEGPVIERSDGYYWLEPERGTEVGPFESYELAQAHRDAVGDEALAPGDALQQAEREIGMSGWLDPETGEPAEGESPPRLQED